MATASVLPSAIAGLALLVAVTAVLCWQKAPGTSRRATAAVGLALVLAASVAFVTVDGGGPLQHSGSGHSTT